MVSQRRLRHESRRSLPPCIAQRNQEALEHLGLAHHAARRQQQRGPEEFEDLLQESRLGLIRGLDRLDPQRGLKPTSYLLARATGQVLHYRRDRYRAIRIPWRLREPSVIQGLYFEKASHSLEGRLLTHLGSAAINQ